jgi:hypothetical protein
MSSTEGLEILKNWRNSKTVVVLTSVPLLNGGPVYGILRTARVACANRGKL